MKTRITELLGVQYPLLQGGMAWIADSQLAAAVSNAGGVGLIAGGAAPVDYIRDQIRRAKELTDKPFGVNIMLMSPNAADLAELVIDEQVSLVTTGAGSPGRYIPAWKEAGIKVIPVIPTVALAKRMEQAGADAVIAEGTESGGHIGEITTMCLVPQVVDAVQIPVIAAGGIADGRGVAAAFMLGAQGVQLGTRFVTTEECDAADAYKQAYLSARKEDIVIVKSPVGMPGRAIQNAFLEKVAAGERFMSGCRHCIKTCDPKTAPYCITRALINAATGDVDNGLLFCGSNAWRAQKIERTVDIMEEMA